MYAQVEKPKENTSKAAANSVTQSKSKGKQSVGFVDNRTKPFVFGKKSEVNNVVSMKRSGLTLGKSAVLQKVLQMAEPADYINFLQALINAGYKGAVKTHVPHNGSEVRPHYYTKKMQEARAFAQEHPEANIDLTELDKIQAKYIK